MHLRLQFLAAVGMAAALAGCGQRTASSPNLKVGEARDELVDGAEVTFNETGYIMPLKEADPSQPSSAPPTESDGSEESSSTVLDGNTVSSASPDDLEAGASSDAPGVPHLNYYGGPVIPNVKVVTIFWGANVNNQAALNRFYTAVTNSPYLDWLRQYSTRTQTIGRGGLLASYVDRNPPRGTTISNQQIQGELNRLINARAVPANDGNTLYMFHFPAGISITLGSSRSCVQFCAYHSTFVRNRTNVYYGVMPDLTGGCARGCGPNTYFNNTTSASSHELIEAITDAAVGLATVIGPPLAWYDRVNGEIGDICNQSQTVVAGYTVQRGWSNAGNFCRAQ